MNEQIYEHKMLVELTQLQHDVAELEVLHKQVSQGFRRLSEQADCINAIATQLEIEILKFQEIALETNQVYYVIQKPLRLNQNNLEGFSESRCIPINIWEVSHSQIPIIMRKKAGFILTAKNINLSQNNC